MIVMIQIYGLKNCDRCRAAQKWFKAQGLETRFHDVRQDGFPVKAAKGWVAALGAESVVNRRSTTWRQLPPAHRAPDMTPSETLALLGEYPALLKRPVMEIDDRVFIGFNDTVKAEITRALESHS